VERDGIVEAGSALSSQHNVTRFAANAMVSSAAV
jgi:hypothetical protein